MPKTKIKCIKWAQLHGKRPRKAGCNSRLGEHGIHVKPPIAAIFAENGAIGFGRANISKEQAQSLIGFHIEDIFDLENGVKRQFHWIEYPIWDLVGQLANKPIYSLLNPSTCDEDVFTVPCYDTSLYIDDLHLTDHKEAADLIASEAIAGRKYGHRNFKIKVGRGAMHMVLESGTTRDIMVVNAVRNTIGPQAKILLDANNGYNLNLTKQVLAETAEAHIHWIEEAFHEDPKLYENLKNWLQKEGLQTLIADGEGSAAPNLLDWARNGLVDVIQYDIFGYGFMPWLKLGSQLDQWNVRSAPHHYGGYYGNFVSCHLAAGIQLFEFVEWDQASIFGIDDSAYKITDGFVNVPKAAGFGLSLDQEIFNQQVEQNGFVSQ
ncbi:mandelate racemase [Candidatus Poribacteria bacterium]|nr:mandelate racemase [Candidatus Poribacteria bacterium]